MLKHLCGAAILGAGLALAATNANAVTLVDPTLSNTSVTFDEASGRFTSWMVNGVEQLKTSPNNSGLFYYYDGSAQQGLGDAAATSNYTPGVPFVPAVANVTITKSDFTAELQFSLQDSNLFGKSILDVTGTITNTSGKDLNNFSIIDFTDLDLNGTALNDSLSFTAGLADQTDGGPDVGYDAAFAFQWLKNLGTDANAKSFMFSYQKSITLDRAGREATGAGFADPDLDARHDATTTEFGDVLTNPDQTPVLGNNDVVPGPGAAIPEPATTLLSFLGLSALGTLALRRRSAK